MNPRVRNIFAESSRPEAGAEEVSRLFENAACRIERIVSRSHSTPPGAWYDQNEDEWVMVLRGVATLEFEAGGSVNLTEGDYVIIPRHVKHRVGDTSQETVWLAVHIR